MLGLSDLRLRLGFLRDRLDTLRDTPPTPRSVLWIEELRGTADTLDSLERPLLALFLVALFFVLWSLGRVFSDRFRLLKGSGEGGPGLRAHVDPGQVLRVAAAFAITAWLTGLLAPLGIAVARMGGPTRLAGHLLGGLPGILSLLPRDEVWLLHSVLLGISLWWVWGPRGLVCGDRTLSRSTVLGYGFLAGLSLLPAVMLLHGGRLWLEIVTQAVPISDQTTWKALLPYSLLVPLVAGGCLWLSAVLFRPAVRPLPALLGLVVLAAALQFGGWGLGRRAVGAVEATDFRETSLARKLHLEPSPFRRLSMILGPEGQIAYSAAEDGSAGVPWDRVACNGTTVQAAEAYLRETRGRTYLTFRAFEHLHACASLDWLDHRNLTVSLEMLEVNPTPVAARWLVEKLQACPTSPENRRVLDAVADAARFTWKEPEGARTLGDLFTRFGDTQRAREYFFRAQLNDTERAQALGGIRPLADGTVSGRLTVNGRPREAVRVGLVGLEHWRRLRGPNRPHTWGLVLTSAHTDARGFYRFRYIPQGEYALVVTGGGIGGQGGTPFAVPHPGTVRLNRFLPRVTVPDFDIRFQPGRPDPFAGPGTMARSRRPRPRALADSAAGRPAPVE